MSSAVRSRSPYAIEELTVTLHRSAAGVAWRWRTELLIAAALVAAYLRVSWWLGTYSWSLAVLGGAALVLGLVPYSRRFVLARFWCLFTRHRLQRAFWELRLHTRAGRLPLILRTCATPVGCRVLVLNRAGLAVEDFEDKAAWFASACGARQARVTCSARWSWLIWISVVRRDVLGSARVIRSPLADGVPALGTVPVAGSRLADAAPDDMVSSYIKRHVVPDQLGFPVHEEPGPSAGGGPSWPDSPSRED